MSPKYNSQFERLPQFRGCYNFRYRHSDSPRGAVLLLHGFPGEQTQQNQDLAEMLAAQAPVDTFVLHYRGLGQSPGEFGFFAALEDAINYAYWILAAGYTEFSLLGHSFGGWMSTAVAAEMNGQLKRVVLLSPLNWLPAAEHLHKFIEDIKVERPHLLTTRSTAELVEELSMLYKMHSPMELAKRANHINVTVIQALRDAIVPPETTREWIKNFSGKIQYIEQDQDHRFSENRPSIVQTLVQIFA